LITGKEKTLIEAHKNPQKLPLETLDNRGRENFG